MLKHTRTQFRFTLAAFAVLGCFAYAPGAWAACSTLTNGIVPLARFNASGNSTVFTESTSTATATVQGAIAYDTSAGALKVCDGANWIALAAGSGSAVTGTGSAGYVPYWSSASALSYDNTSGGQFFWDATNHRLGIGTATPGVPLDVKSASTSNQSIANFLQPNLPTSGVTYIKLGQSLSDYNQADIRFAYVGNNSTSNYLGFGFYNTSTLMSVRVDGNVGIGTTSPSTRLEVRGGDLRVSTSDWVASTTGSFLNVGPGATTGNTYIKIQGYTDGGTSPGVLALNPVAGNVGIGISSPSQRLDVGGIIQSASSAPAFFLNKTNAPVDSGRWQIAPSNTDLNVQALTDAGGGGGNYFSFTRSAQQINNFTGYKSGNAWFTVDNNAGNVGIGTTSPGSPLTVAPPTSFTTGTIAAVTAPTVSQTGSVTGLSVNMAGYTPGNYSNTGINVPSFTGGNNGTNNYGLYVGTVNGAGSAYNAGIYVNAATGSGGWGGTGIRLTGGGTGTHDYAIYNDATGKNYFAGKLGLGQVSPQNPLAVSPVQYSTGTASQSGTTVTGVGTTWTSSMVGSELLYTAQRIWGGVITAVNSATSLTVSTSQTVGSQTYNINYPGLQVTSTGSVGVGTGAPAARVDIQQSADTAAANGLRVLNSGNTLGVFLWIDGSSNAHLDSGASGTGSLVINAGGGKVGIGTTSPDANALLDVTSTTKGFLLPRMTTAQANTLDTATSTNGMMIFDTDTGTVKVQVGGAFVSLATGGGSTVTGTGSTGYVPYWSSASALSYDNTSGGQFFWDATNHRLGIGTTGPSDRLTVDGNVGFSSGAGVGSTGIMGNRTTGTLQLYAGTSSTAGGYIELYGATHATRPGGLILGAGNGGSVGIWDYNGSGWDQNMTILSSGNVGIGTTTPRGPLHVQEGGNATYVYIQGGVANGDGTAFTSTDTIPIQSGAGPSGYNGLALIPKEWGGTTTDQHNQLYIAGSQRVSGAVAASLAFGNWGYFTGTGSAAGELGNTTAKGDAAKFWFALTDQGSEFVQRLNLFARSASGTNTNALSVLSNGNVGIGTTTPKTTLDVNGGFAMPSAGAAMFNLYYSSGWKYRGTGYGSGMYESSGKLIFANTAASGTADAAATVADRLTIDSAGNVGIGTTTPSKILSVYKSGNAQIQVDTSAGSSTGLVLNSDTYSSIVSTAAFGIFVGGSERVRIHPTSGYMGIGTGSPVSQLDVAGGARVGTDATCTAAKAGMLAWNSNVLQVCTDAGTFTDIASSGSGGSQWVNGTSGAIYYNGGNVGIGTATPATDLQIYNATATPTLSIKNGGDTSVTRAINLDFTTTTSSARIALARAATATAGTIMKFSTQADGAGAMSERMRIDQNGNIGIGTTSPQMLLDVKGSSIFTDQSASAGNFTMSLAQGSTGDVSLSMVKGGTRRWTMGLDSADSYKFKIATTTGIHSYATDTKFMIDNNGNVGIGTTSPATALDVAGEINSVKNDDWFNISASEYANAKSATIRLMRARGTSAAPTQLLSGDIIGSLTYRSTFNPLNGAAVISSATENQGTGAFGSNLQFQTVANGTTSGATRMTIDQNGNVGIGTATTNFPLTVSSANYASGNYTATQQLLDSTTMAADVGGGISFGGKYTTAGAGAEWGAITTGKDNATSGDYAAHMAFFTRANGGSTSERMRISSNGNVGIGTTTPSYLLQANSSTVGSPGVMAVSSATSASNQSVGQLSFYNTGVSTEVGRISVSRTGSNYAGVMHFYTYPDAGSLTESMTILGSGNVGIGITGPGQKLEVAGNLRLNATFPKVLLYDSAGTANARTFYWLNTSGGTYGRWVNDADSAIVAESIYFKNNGNVGIGTTSPSQRLEVNGSVLAAAYLYSSDARLKSDVAALPGQLDKLSALRPVSFKYTADQKGETHLGLIAQEAETVYPELVKTDDKGMKAIDYPGLIAPLISAVQELRAQNAQLRAELDALKSAQQK